MTQSKGYHLCCVIVNCYKEKGGMRKVVPYIAGQNEHLADTSYETVHYTQHTKRISTCLVSKFSVRILSEQQLPNFRHHLLTNHVKSGI